MTFLRTAIRCFLFVWGLSIAFDFPHLRMIGIVFAAIAVLFFSDKERPRDF